MDRPLYSEECDQVLEGLRVLFAVARLKGDQATLNYLREKLESALNEIDIDHRGERL